MVDALGYEHAWQFNVEMECRVLNTELFDRFSKRGQDFLGVRYPFICGAMTWVSDPKLVAAVANAGGFACLAGGNTPVDILEQQIEETRKLTDKPFGVNVITIAPLYKEHLQLLQRVRVQFVIFAGSFPRGSEVKMMKDVDAKVLCFASTASIARRMVKYGADALILEGMEAGGHVGHVTLTVLLQQVLFEIDDIPIFVGGGVATGRMCGHLLAMGAAGVQFGTIFAMAEECCAHADFKEAFINAKARDAVSTPQYDSSLPVVAVRSLRNKSTDDFGRLQVELLKKMKDHEITRLDAQMEVEGFWMGRLRTAVIEGDVERGSMMAGQSVGLVDKVAPVAEIISELVSDAEATLQKLRADLK